MANDITLVVGANTKAAKAALSDLNKRIRVMQELEAQRAKALAAEDRARARLDAARVRAEQRELRAVKAKEAALERSAAKALRAVKAEEAAAARLERSQARAAAKEMAQERAIEVQRARAEKASLAAIAKRSAAESRAHALETRRIAAEAAARTAAARRSTRAGASAFGTAGRALGGGAGATLAASGAAAGTALGAAAVGVAAVGFGAVKAAQAYAKLNYELVRVQQVAGASDAEFRALTAQVRDLGRTTVFTAQEVAEGGRFLAMAGYDVAEMSKALPVALGIAEVGMVSVGEAADTATNILAGFGEGSDKLAKRADQLAATFTNSNTTISELGQGFKDAGSVARTMNVPFEDIATALGLLGNAGFKAARAGTGLRNIMGRLAAPTRASQRAFDVMNISAKTLAEEGIGGLLKRIEEATSEMAPDAAYSVILQGFGTRAGPQMAALLNQGSEAFRELRHEVDGSAGSLDRIREKLSETTVGRWKTLKSAVSDFAVGLGENLDPALNFSLANMTSWILELNAMTVAASQAAMKLLGINVGIENIETDRADRVAKERAKLDARLAEVDEKLDKMRSLANNRALPESARLAAEKGFDKLLREAADIKAQLNGEYKKIIAALADPPAKQKKKPRIKIGGDEDPLAEEEARNRQERARRRREAAEEKRRREEEEAARRAIRIKKDADDAIAAMLRVEDKNAAALNKAEQMRDAALVREAEKQRAAYEKDLELWTKLQEEKAAIAQQKAEEIANHFMPVFDGAIGLMGQFIDGAITGQDKLLEAMLAGFLRVVGSQLIAVGTRGVAEGLIHSLNPMAPGSGAGMIAAGGAAIAGGLAMGGAGTAIMHMAEGGTIGRALPDGGSGISSGGFSQAARPDPQNQPITININNGLLGPHPERIASAVMDAVRLGTARGL